MKRKGYRIFCWLIIGIFAGSCSVYYNTADLNSNLSQFVKQVQNNYNTTAAGMKKLNDSYNQLQCSDEKDLYRYVSKGWNVDKILRNGDISYSDTGHKLYYLSDEPQIHLSKGNSIKVLNFGWRCWFEQGPENNLTKKDELGP